jgi:hypothetical protein
MRGAGAARRSGEIGAAKWRHHNFPRLIKGLSNIGFCRTVSICVIEEARPCPKAPRGPRLCCGKVANAPLQAGCAAPDKFWWVIAVGRTKAPRRHPRWHPQHCSLGLEGLGSSAPSNTRLLEHSRRVVAAGVAHSAPAHVRPRSSRTARPNRSVEAANCGDLLRVRHSGVVH